VHVVAVDAPEPASPAESREQRKLVPAADSRIGCRAVALATHLQKLSVLVALAEEGAIQIGALVALYGIDSSGGRRTIDGPRSAVDAKLIRAALDRHLLERPDLDLGEIERAARARIEIVDLHSVDENAHASRIARIRCELRRREASARERRDARYEIEQLRKRQRARREQFLAIPGVLLAHTEHRRQLGVCDRRLDRVLRDLGGRVARVEAEHRDAVTDDGIGG
jgi:hypothetical protein